MDKMKNQKQFLFDTLDAQDASQILKILYAEDSKIAARIEKIANEYLSGVDVEEIAENVYADLDDLQVEDLWDRSGPHHDGYSEPGEMAYEMVEEVLEPYLADMKKYQKLDKPKEAKLYCMGILKGIGRYEKESKSQFKEWAGDGVGDSFSYVFIEWEKGSQNVQECKDLKEFVKNNFQK